jgi:hypothetical protein
MIAFDTPMRTVVNATIDFCHPGAIYHMCAEHDGLNLPGGIFISCVLYLSVTI